MRILIAVLSMLRHPPMLLLLVSGLSVSSILAAAEIKPGASSSISSPSANDVAHLDFEATCANAQPDREYFIPENFADEVIASGSGRYAYEGQCPFWIVDFSMNNKSNTFMQDGVRIKENTQFYGIPNDLPSTESSAPALSPMTQEDCKRYQLSYMVYTKFKHEPNFVFRGKYAVNHKMTGSNCYIPQPSKFKTKAPDANVLVIRVVTRMKLRTSWQEAAARANDAPTE
jgi:hypothetical protein